MTLKEPEATQQHIADTDRIVEGGWEAVIDSWRTLTVRLLEVVVNLQAHYKPALSYGEGIGCGMFDCDPIAHVPGAVYIINGFKPVAQGSNPVIISPFNPAMPKPRVDTPSSDMICRQFKTIDDALYYTVDAIEILAERPTMPQPTVTGIANLYIELARYRGMHRALTATAVADLSPRSGVSTDVFGVGKQLAKVVGAGLTPRCIPEIKRISLPVNPEIDHILSAYLLRKYVMRCDVCFEFVDDSFSASLTNTTNHGTIAAGGVPHHAPEHFCFDSRVEDSPLSNIDLVINEAATSGMPMDFAKEISQVALNNQDESFKFESGLISAFFEVADSPSLAMAATELFLDTRFPTSEAYKKWTADRSNARREADPVFQQFAPKPTPIPGMIAGPLANLPPIEYLRALSSHFTNLEANQSHG